MHVVRTQPNNIRFREFAVEETEIYQKKSKEKIIDSRKRQMLLTAPYNCKRNKLESKDWNSIVIRIS